jgi:Cdc6-like AAA superfamily ATPase
LIVYQVNYNATVSSGGVAPTPLLSPNPSALFTGRKEIIDKLKNHFGSRVLGEPTAQRRFLLYGMGGIGKTQISLKFIEEISHKCVLPLLHSSGA